MIKTEQALFEIFDQLNIQHKTYYHEATHRFDELRHIRDQISGVHCKSLFLTDKKNFYFISLRGEIRLDLNQLRKDLGVRRLSFAKEEDMLAIIGVGAGNCTPYALINDDQHKIAHIFLDAAFQKAEFINFHPLHNKATTQIRVKDFIRWIDYCGHPYKYIPV